MKRVITAELVESEHAAGRRRIGAPRGHVVVTPGAWSRARELGVELDESEAAAPPPAEPASCERTVDPSGVVVVRGASVRLGEFSGAGPGRHVGLADVVTGRDRAPMTAGFMSWRREDSFPWKLDYDEIDLVLEGTLRITIDGRALEGGPGDVFYLPKGSRIEFGTPTRTRIFYVTYPADWAGAAG